MISQSGIGPAGNPEGVGAVVVGEGKRRRATERFHSRQCAELGKEALEELPLCFGVGVLAPWQHEVGRHDLSRIKSRIGGPQISKTFDEQSGTGEKEERERHLRDDQGTAQSMRFRTSSAAT